MKLLFRFAVLLLLSVSSFAQDTTSTNSFTVTADGLYDAAQYPVGPGGTIYIKAGTYKYLRFRNYKGSASAPIRVVNLGGLVNLISTDTNLGGINFLFCEYFRLTGSGDETLRYGIKVSQTGPGASAISISNKSTECELERIEIAHAGFAGMMVKTDPDGCDPSTWRGNFVMMNVRIHDNYIHDTQGEGLYIGNSFWNDGISKSCNGTTYKIYPHEIMGLEIYNNLVERAGCEGIQYACAPDARVHHNTVRDSGRTPFAQFQDNGIQIGGGAGGSFYNNTIRNSPSVGLIIVGHLGNNLIYNNVIVNSGQSGVFVDERSGTLANVPVTFINNTIVNSAQDGFRLYNETQFTYLINNAIVKTGTGKYVYTLDSRVKFSDQNNFKNADVAAAKFMDAATFDLRPAADSPLISTGQDVSSYGISTDAADGPRLVDVTDIGAFECGTALRAARQGVAVGRYLKVTPLATNNQVVVSLSKDERITELAVVDMAGRLVLKQIQDRPTSEVILPVEGIGSGTYVIRVSTSTGKYAGVFSK